MRSQRIAPALAALLLLAGPAAGAAEGADDLGRRIEAHLQPYLDVGHLSGSLLVARGDEIVYEGSFGLANHEHAVANRADTRFCVGSINKPMTIVVAARLVEAGKLALTDPLSKYLGDFPRGGEITVGQLLGHTAGIPHRVTEPLDQTRPQTPASMVELAAGKPLLFDPGSNSSYSSAGFSVLARVLEIAAGRPFAELLEDHVVRPARMTDTSDAGTREILARRASSYYFSSSGLVNAPPEDISYLVGAGSVYSTPRDLFAMQRALSAGRLGELAQRTLVRGAGDLRWNGSAYGYRAFIDYEAATGVTVALAGNIASGAVDRIREALPKLAVGEEVAPPTPIQAAPVEVDAEILAGYLGTYELRPGTRFELRLVDGQLRMSDWLLIPTSDTTFFSPQDYGEIAVVKDEEGAVRGMDWTVGGQTYPMPRVAAAGD